MEKKVTKAGTTAAKPAAKPTMATASAKKEIETNMKAAAKTTEKMCAELLKKVLNHKSATLPEITAVNGIGKDDMLKLIEILDAMGSATYNTACALRELQRKMK